MENNLTFDEKINFIKEAILKYVPAKYIYLFGSYAYGEPTEDSDIDIYTVVPDDIERDPFLHGNIIWDLGDMNIHQVDLLIKPESIFNYRKTRSLFEGIICDKGKLIYESA